MCSAIPSVAAVNQHRMSGDDLVKSEKSAVENEPNVLEPLGVLERAYEELLVVAASGRTQAVAHRVYVLDVHEDELARRVVLLVLVAAARRIVRQSVLEWPRV